MDPAWSVELRYAEVAKWRDAAFAGFSGMIAGSVSWRWLHDLVPTVTIWHVAASWVAAALPILLCRALVAWGARARLDGRVLRVEGGRLGPTAELAWAEVEEIFPLHHGGFKIRGDGRVVLCPWWFEGAPGARGFAVEQARPGIERRILERIDAGGVAVLPGPWSRARGFAVLAGVGLLWTSPAALLVRSGRDPLGCWVVFGLLLLFATLVVAGRLLWSFAEVEVDVDGLRVRRLRRGPRFAWDRILEIRTTEEGGAILIFGWRESLTLPPVTANLWMLPRLHALRRGPSR